MAYIFKGSARFFLLLGVLIPIIIRGEDADSLVNTGGISDLAYYLEDMPRRGSQFIRIRAGPGRLEQSLDLSLPLGFSFKHRDRILSDGGMEQGNSFKWEAGGFRLIRGSGYVHINQGVIRGRSMKRLGNRLSSMKMAGRVKVRSHAAFWNDELQYFAWSSDGFLAFVLLEKERTGVGLSGDNGEGLFWGAVLHDDRKILTEFWLERNTRKLWRHISLSLAEDKVINHINIGRGRRLDGLETGINILFLPSGHKDLDSDSPWGSSAGDGSLSAAGFIRKKISRELAGGFRLSLVNRLARETVRSISVEINCRGQPWKYDIHVRHKEKYEELDHLPYSRKLIRSMNDIIVNFSYDISRMLHYRSTFLVRPGAAMDHYILNRVDLRKEKLRLTLQYLHAMGVREAMYSVRPYSGSSYVMEYLSGREDSFDARLSFKREHNEFSLLYGRNMNNIRILVQLQMDLS